MGVEIDNEVYAALQTLGQETVVDLARHLVRARCMHPVFAQSAEHAGRVVLAEATELMEEAGVNHARAHAEAMDVVVTGLRFMGREWEPTRGREELLEPFVDIARGIAAMYDLPGVDDGDGYDSLRAVLAQAVKQASDGKGRERHASGEPFEEQTICQTTRAHGLGFATGQAEKKARESHRLRLMHNGYKRAVAELLGSINYLAAAVIVLQEEVGHNDLA